MIAASFDSQIDESGPPYVTLQSVSASSAPVQLRESTLVGIKVALIPGDTAIAPVKCNADYNRSA